MEAITTATQRNAEIVQQGFQEFAKGNISAIIDLCTEDVRWGTFKVPNVPFTGMFQGKEGVQEYFTGIARSINFSSFEPKTFLAQHDRVVVLGSNSGTVKETGKSFANEWCMSFRLREGKIAEYFSFSDSYDIYRNFQP